MLFDYYTEFYLAKAQGAYQQVKISISECARIFYCSERNAKLIIHKLEHEHWIQWVSGRGRGNKSQVAFLKPLSSLVDEQIDQFIKSHQLDKALTFIQSHSLPDSVTEKCYKRITQEFGYRTENKEHQEMDILRIPMRRRLATLDPAFAAITSESHIARQLFDCLVNYNIDLDAFVPHLAHSWEVSSDQRRWTFYLRKGVTFHHGRELTSEDVLFTIRRICDPVNQVPCRWYFRSISDVSAVHPYVLKLTFTEPTPALLFFSSLNLAILSSDVGFNPEHIIGTGPFRIVKYNSRQLVLERFGDYFNLRALLNRVELYYAPDLISSQKTYDVPNKQRQSVNHEEVHEDIGSNYIMFNFKKKGPQQDYQFRKLFDLIIDRQALIHELGGNRVRVSNSFLETESGEPSRVIARDDQVKQSLFHSRYNGEMLKFYYFGHHAVKLDAQWIQKRAAERGIHLELHPLSLSDFYSEQLTEEADMVLGGEVMEENHELGIAHLFRDESSLIRRMINQEQARRIDLFIDQFLQTGNEIATCRVFQQLEDYMKKNHLLIFMYHSSREIMFHSALEGIKLNAFGWADFSKLWIKPDLSAGK
ncbi:ABC transporter substrate-binding protein [Sporolactobacillus shoreicorticis]|uniref:ABC transporter substrate-binding protein n=1 Tax=Sporolactobacillus shoreicorticis TaxID=1923877 RepID=A0ABW5S6M6_9BACL|nr:ABC transporter substrate-binding protein [Sporolactobacillus shoreicorticis]MCO7126558.1 ABC transporter substrate-binding protein [Sporolactobacillus shoreicorticis]